MPSLIFNGLVAFAAAVVLWIAALALSYEGASALVRASSIVALFGTLAMVVSLAMLAVGVVRMVRKP